MTCVQHAYTTEYSVGVRRLLAQSLEWYLPCPWRHLSPLTGYSPQINFASCMPFHQNTMSSSAGWPLMSAGTILLPSTFKSPFLCRASREACHDERFTLSLAGNKTERKHPHKADCCARLRLCMTGHLMGLPGQAVSPADDAA